MPAQEPCCAGSATSALPQSRTVTETLLHVACGVCSCSNLCNSSFLAYTRTLQYVKTVISETLYIPSYTHTVLVQQTPTYPGECT